MNDYDPLSVSLQQLNHSGLYNVLKLNMVTTDPTNGLSRSRYL